MNSDLCRRIDAFEMWLYRRMLRISYVDYITNERVLQLVGEKRSEETRETEEKGRRMCQIGLECLMLIVFGWLMTAAPGES